MGPYVPPGQSPPFEVIDEYHRAAYIIITTALGLVISLVCFQIRLYVRLYLIPPFARDDFVLLGATVSSETFDGVVHCAMTKIIRYARASAATLVLCTAWLIPAVFIILVNCELNKPWRSQGGQCRNLSQRWQFIAAVDAITELIIFVLAVALLKGLFMNLRRKLTIGFAFIFRFPYAVSPLGETDVTVAAIEPSLWLQVQVHYALVACSVFCLRPFMAAVSTNYGTAGDSTLESSASRSRGTKESSKSGSNSGSGSNSHSASRSMSMSRIQRKRAGTAATPPWSKSHAIPRSSSKENLCQDGNIQPIIQHPEIPRKKQIQASPQGREPAVRTPQRRSMFPLGEPNIPPLPKPQKGKEGTRRQVPDQSLLDTDAIELMPRLQRQHGRQQSEVTVESDDSDRMVIRKEVGYSIQYEYDDARRRGQGPSKKSSTDAMAYV
ncbi:unnamed protein product [Penicillium pancosmium]